MLLYLFDLSTLILLIALNGLGNAIGIEEREVRNLRYSLKSTGYWTIVVSVNLLGKGENIKDEKKNEERLRM